MTQDHATQPYKPERLAEIQEELARLREQLSPSQYALESARLINQIKRLKVRRGYADT
jgi:hypothetical protein